jgi:hypothetical protein
MAQRDPSRHRPAGQRLHRRHALGPLDEGHDLRPEVRVEQPRILVLESSQAVEIEMGERAGGAVVELPTTNVGLVIGPLAPSARSAPRTNVVLPAPSSPETSTTSPGRSALAS